jgi:hypothetical protein
MSIHASAKRLASAQRKTRTRNAIRYCCGWAQGVLVSVRRHQPDDARRTTICRRAFASAGLGRSQTATQPCPDQAVRYRRADTGTPHIDVAPSARWSAHAERGSDLGILEKI